MCMCIFLCTDTEFCACVCVCVCVCVFLSSLLLFYGLLSEINFMMMMIIHIIHAKMNLSTAKWAQWDKTQSRELLVCSYVSASHCAQLLHTILHRTDLIVSPLPFRRSPQLRWCLFEGSTQYSHLVIIIIIKNVLIRVTLHTKVLQGHLTQLTQKHCRSCGTSYQWCLQ